MLPDLREAAVRFGNVGVIRLVRFQQNRDGAVRILVPCCWLFWKTVKTQVFYRSGSDWYDVQFASVEEAHAAIRDHNRTVREQLSAKKRRSEWQDTQPPGMVREP